MSRKLCSTRFGLAMMLLLASCLAGAHPLLAAPLAAAAERSADGTVLLARRGWHIDIGFATAALEGPLAGVAQRFPAAHYLFFGFGDLRYLLSKHHNGPVLLEALWPGRALMLVTAIDGAPEAAFGPTNVIALPLGAAARSAVQRFVLASFKHEADRTPAEYAPGPYEGSAYYLATAQYSALHTCNTWVAEALAAGGLPIHARGVILASQLWRRVRRLAGAQPSAFEGIPAH